MFSKCEKNAIICVLFFILLLVICAYRFELGDWFISPVGDAKIPMYVYLYPIITAIVAGTFAIYAAHKAFDAALMSDRREREFRDDELERKRLTYACDLFYDLRAVQVVCDTALSHTLNVIKGNVERKEFGVLKLFLREDIFAFIPTSMQGNWETQSCLKKETLKILFKIRADIQRIINTAKVLHGHSEMYENMLKLGKLPEDHKTAMSKALDTATNECKKLSEEISSFRVHLNEHYDVRK